jgi:serine/threonine protein kinase
VLVHLPKSEPNVPVAWVADFGASVIGRTATTHVVHPDYRSPELHAWIKKNPIQEKPRDKLTKEELATDEQERRERNKLLEKADVYSFGATAFKVRVCRCSLPDIITFHSQMLTDERVFTLKDWRTFSEAEWLQGLGEQIFQLIRCCCHDDPDQRPTMEHAKKQLSDICKGKVPIP